jgi:hypothetical protein
MRFRYTESFPKHCPDVEDTMRVIRRIVEDRLAEAIVKKLEKETKSNIA